MFGNSQDQSIKANFKEAASHFSPQKVAFQRLLLNFSNNVLQELLKIPKHNSILKQANRSNLD
jgi:hypothetical protein